MNLHFLLPKGRLFSACRNYLRLIGCELHDPLRNGYCGKFESSEFTIHFWARKPSMIPHLLHDSRFHAGITGEDMFIQAQCPRLQSLKKLLFSSRMLKATSWVLAGKEPFNICEDATVGCEWEHLCNYLISRSVLRSICYQFVLLDGDEETAIEDGLCEWIICPTETGESLKFNGLSVKEELMQSGVCVYARNDIFRKDMEILENLIAALCAAHDAHQRKMVLFDLPASIPIQKLELHSSVSPSVSNLVDSKWKAYTTCCHCSDLPTILGTLKKAGAKGIVVHDVQGYIA